MLTVKVDIGSKSKKSIKNSTKAHGGTGFPSGAARPLVHAFTGIRKRSVSVTHVRILTVRRSGKSPQQAEDVNTLS